MDQGSIPFVIYENLLYASAGFSFLVGPLALGLEQFCTEQKSEGYEILHYLSAVNSCIFED